MAELEPRRAKSPLLLEDGKRVAKLGEQDGCDEAAFNAAELNPSDSQALKAQELFLSSAPLSPRQFGNSIEWNRLRKEFYELANEESQRLHGIREDRYIHVHVDRSNENGECGHCRVYEGMEEFRTRFLRLATSAGIALGSPRSDQPVSYWLDGLFQDLLENRSKHLRFATTKYESGIIEYACRASAIFCERLETRAIEDEHNRPRLGATYSSSFSSEGQRISPVGIAEWGALPNKPGRAARLPGAFVAFAGEIWSKAVGRVGKGAVSSEQLEVIAIELDSKGYVPPAKYLERRCAEELRSYNSRNSRSKSGPIDCWVKLVATADKDHLRGMRRLLSRCSAKVRLLK